MYPLWKGQPALACSHTVTHLQMSNIVTWPRLYTLKILNHHRLASMLYRCWSSLEAAATTNSKKKKKTPVQLGKTAHSRQEGWNKIQKAYIQCSGSIPATVLSVNSYSGNKWYFSEVRKFPTRKRENIAVILLQKVHCLWNVY